MSVYTARERSAPWPREYHANEDNGSIRRAERFEGGIGCADARYIVEKL